MRRRGRWLAVVTAGLLAVGTLAVVPAAGSGPVTAELGVLRLHLNTDGDRVVWDPSTGSDQTQNLSQSNCKLSAGSVGGPLVTLSSTSANSSKKPYPGLKDHRIGVGQKGEGSGEPCARINKDLGQTLTMALTNAIPGEEIGYAEIDLGFKFDSYAKLELRRGGALVQTITVPCNGLSDCGPDSHGSDNERVILWLDPSDDPGSSPHWQAFHLSGTFDSITFRAGSGAISLEGGYSGSAPGPLGQTLGTADTLFRVVQTFDGEIDCGDTVTLGGGDDPTFSITRGYDTTGAEDCKGPADGLLYNFTAGTDGTRKTVDFVTEPVDSNPATTAQFLEVITWTFDSPPDVPGGDGQFLALSYDDHVGAGERVMPWCLIDPRVGGELPSPLDPSTVLPSGHTSCLIESESHVTLTGHFVSVDTVYNIGDGKRYK